MSVFVGENGPQFASLIILNRESCGAEVGHLTASSEVGVNDRYRQALDID